MLAQSTQRAAATTRGILIALEGCDRSGKSTQCKLLVDTLKESGTPAKLMRFPARDTTIGKMIDEYLKSNLELSDQAIHLLFSANRWELKEAMERELASGTTIVLDRYAYSGVAFTAAKGKGLTLEWCKAPDAGLLAPDLTLFLDIPIADAAARGNFGEERYETTAFQERVHEKFRELMTPDWKIIDARQSMETVAQLILRHAHDALSKRTTAPIATLW